MYDSNTYQIAQKFIPNDVITMENGREAISNHLTYLKNEFINGVSVNELVECRTAFIDSLLIHLWYQFSFDKFKDLALVAVGGYGRADLQPHSDIDILFITLNNTLPEDLTKIIPSFTSLLWDLKLDLGQSVRTLSECITEGKQDVTIATNLLESRLIIGNKETFEQLNKFVESEEFWTAKNFYEAKIAEQEKRHHAYKDTIYMLEPDIKNNPGGLRDIQTILWLAHKTLGVKSLREMKTFKLLTRMEYYEIQECQDFLWRVRFALHLTLNKLDNRLTFDRQQKVANYLGYTGEGNTPVESFMRRFYQTMHRVSELNEIVIQLLYEKIYHNVKLPEKVYNQHFVIRGALIDINDPDIFIEKPETILELFLILTEHSELTGIYVECIRYLRNARRRINFYLDEHEQCREIFKKIIKNPRALDVALPTMHKHHIISLYMPHWNEISGLMQFDMFHTYTVDEHTMRVLKNIYNFSQKRNSQFSLYKQIYSQLEKPELLFLAALFHDIAKGRNGHHAELGAPDALYFCQLHGYNRYESRLVAWIVRNHLYMSTVAQRRDISDPDIIADFAKKVGDESFLNYLYCLTVADICATNETEWNSYKDSLFKVLYFSARNALRQGLENPPDLRLHVRENQQRALEILTKIGMDPLSVFKTWGNFRLEYFIKYLPEQIAWHTQNIVNHNNSDSPLILFGQNNNINGTELFVYYKDSVGLFAKVTGVLGEKNLNVLASIISNTTNGYALDTFTFMEKNGGPVPFERLSNLRKALTIAVTTQEKLIPKAKPLPLKLKQFKHPTIVSYLPDKDHKYTSLEISTLDIPGLLARIGLVFQENDLIIHAAKITTTGERADDFFSLTSADGSILTDEQKVILQEQLISELNADKDNTNSAS
ncbi:MAG: [protein-PII] uridylyltransferase [Succinivibrionaceae bacterium]